MPTTNTYTTSQGETWDIIARVLWGSEKLCHKLIEANPAHRGTVFFSAGTVLAVPEVETSKTVTSLPPWKQ